MTGDTLLRFDNLKVYYPKRSGLLKRVAYNVKAVNEVSFSIERGSTFGLVGESGCGKSSIGKAVIGLAPITSGFVRLGSTDLGQALVTDRRGVAARVQMIFQDPYASLNPKMSIGRIVQEATVLSYPDLDEEASRKKTCWYLERVGLHAGDYFKYPHEFSGGQRQRVGIARALAMKPEFIICDECVSALDVSIQASILNLLLDLQAEFNLTYLFISHDLSVVKFIAHTIGVMCLGEIVELGQSDSIFNTPRHPYTSSLIASIPDPDPAKAFSHTVLPGDVPSPVNLPGGCYFQDRCPRRFEKCGQHPQLKQTGGREIRCHLFP